MVLYIYICIYIYYNMAQYDEENRIESSLIYSSLAIALECIVWSASTLHLGLAFGSGA